MIIAFPSKPRLVDENTPSLVDSPTNVWAMEDLKNAKAVASVVEKLYGVKPSLTEVLYENPLYRQSSQGRT